MNILNAEWLCFIFIFFASPRSPTRSVNACSRFSESSTLRSPRLVSLILSNTSESTYNWNNSRHEYKSDLAPKPNDVDLTDAGCADEEWGWNEEIEEIGRAVSETSCDRSSNVCVKFDCTVARWSDIECSAFDSISKNAMSELSGMTTSLDSSSLDDVLDGWIRTSPHKLPLYLPTLD